MRKIYCLLAFFVLLAASCQKDFGNGGGEKPVNKGDIPAGFNWKTTRDVTVTVAAPAVGGVTPAYAVVRIYSSPVLSAENLVAKGAATASASFRTAVTVPTGVENLYIQTTLPDGRKSVEMVAVQNAIDVSGGRFKAAAVPGVSLAEKTLRASSMPDYPKMEVKSEADFSGDPKAIIRTIGNGNYQLGASWAYHAAPEYLIPAGVEITSAIDLNGGFSPYRDPVLYVAGKLTLSTLHIGQARLAVLPGGEVTVKSLSGSGTGDASKPSIYVFEGGKLTLEDKVSLGSKTLVNCGTFVANDDLDLNNSAIFYNDATAEFQADEVKCSNDVKFYNDGKITVEDLKLNSNGEFYNCENGELEVREDCEFERNTTIYQRGFARIDDMTARGTIYVNCHTVVDEIEAQGAAFNFASGVALDAGKVEFNNTTASMASGSVFSIEEYNADDKGGKNYFTAEAGADPRAVVTISEKAYTKKNGHETWFSGALEVVYDNDADDDYTIQKSYLKDGAVLVAEQTVIIPGSVCNGGKAPIVPDVEPVPEESELVAGVPYTYCFEDNWPWFGDYDMNDVVVSVSIDRNVSKDGSKVSSLTINWELKAAGTTYDLAFAVQMDKVPASDVASVVSSHTGFGSGPFASQGLESGQEYAVIPFFNHTSELLASSNTWKGHTVAATTKHTTTIEFAQPVAVADVLETAMNFFITSKTRQNEIHLPTYKPTAAGVIASGCTLPSDPYKFFVDSAENAGDNYMMWALVIPGDFRYPAESKVKHGSDIRNVYTNFLPWASSNGTQYQEWYLDEVDESKLF